MSKGVAPISGGSCFEDQTGSATIHGILEEESEGVRMPKIGLVRHVWFIHTVAVCTKNWCRRNAQYYVFIVQCVLQSKTADPVNI